MESFIREGLHIVNEIPVQDMKYIDHAILNNTPEDSFTLIGEGGSGRVYKYKKYAIKIFHDYVIEGNEDNPLHPPDGHYLSLLDRSPYFPSVYFYIDQHYMVAEFIDGKSIYDVDSHIFVRCISQLRDAVIHAFLRGLIASDLIDANIIISSKNNTPVIVDVGCFYPISYDEEIERLSEEYFRRYGDKILLDVIEKRIEPR